VCDTGGGYPYFEVSAASGESVQEMFHTLFARVIDRVPGLPTDLMDAARALEMGAGIKRRR
jgi:hypothetical protein